MSRYNRLKQPRSNQLSIRGLVVLFLATMAISLTLLLILFNLVFKNIDLNFKTRLPDMAPVPEGEAIDSEAAPPEGLSDEEALSLSAARADAMQQNNGDGLAAFQREGIKTAVLTVPANRWVPPAPEKDDEGSALEEKSSGGVSSMLPDIPEIVLPDITTVPKAPAPMPSRPATHVSPAEDAPVPPMD